MGSRAMYGCSGGYLCKGRGQQRAIALWVTDKARTPSRANQRLKGGESMRLRLEGTIGEIVAILGLMARYEAEDKARRAAS